MKIYRVEIEPGKRVIQAPAGSSLAEALQQAGIPLATWCQRLGLCGRCFVEVVSGPQPPLQEREIFWQQRRHLSRSFRLACLLPVEGDIAVQIPATSLISSVAILEAGLSREIELDPAVKKYVLTLEPPTVDNPASLLSQLQLALKKPELRLGRLLLTELALLEQRVEPRRGGRRNQGGEAKGMPEIISGQEQLESDEPEQSRRISNITAIIYDDEELIAVEPASPPSPTLGLAIDLGTTTLVVEALDLETGQSLGRELSLNHQVRFGADVLSRLSHALKGEAELEELRATVLEDLNRMIWSLLRRLNLAPSHVYEAVIAGNAAMNHLFLGLAPHSLSRAPFAALFSSLPPLLSSDCGLATNPGGKVFLAPNIRGFVGGDISAGLLASGLMDSPGPLAFIDLGTNGEIVIKHDDRLVVTSTAAGPAFEGVNLSCGLIASPGAISRVEQQQNRLVFHTIGDEQARGLCGSGLIDLLAVFLRTGAIDSRGRIQGGQASLPLTAGLSLTQEDVRQAQLACAAVKTGFRFLLESLNLNPGDLKAIYIAGAFGYELSAENSMTIGLLPRLDPARVVFLGNTSLAGARCLLLNRQARRQLTSLLERIEYISLAAKERFQDYFLEALELKPWP